MHADSFALATHSGDEQLIETVLHRRSPTKCSTTTGRRRALLKIGIDDVKPSNRRRHYDLCYGARFFHNQSISVQWRRWQASTIRV